ncbi:hypothetical protein BdWA1_001964 [Babesia duncani]|uniref:Uncharacterized protein n=1 Tax=Babesia duncani TaxID=323732 RepID=A0AAD9PKV6_9APIC|nr:hypothetical protein BdWA1_001964 [Babesia duncani]
MDLCFVYAFVILAYGVNGVAVPLDIIETTETGNIRKGLYGKEDNLKADEYKNIEQIDLNGEDSLRFITATEGFCFDKITINREILFLSSAENCTKLVTWEYWNKMDFISFYIKYKNEMLRSIYERSSRGNWIPIDEREYGKLETLYKTKVTLDIEKVENIPGIKYRQHVYNSEIFRVFDVLQYVFIYKIVSNGVTIINLNGRNNVGSRCVRVIIHGYDGTSQRVRVVIMDEFGKLNNADFMIDPITGCSKIDSYVDSGVWETKVKEILSTLDIVEPLSNDDITYISPKGILAIDNKAIRSSPDVYGIHYGSLVTEIRNLSIKKKRPIEENETMQEEDISTGDGNSVNLVSNTLRLDNDDGRIRIEKLPLDNGECILIYHIEYDTFFDKILFNDFNIELNVPLKIEMLVTESWKVYNNWIVTITGINLNGSPIEERVTKYKGIWFPVTNIMYTAYEVFVKQGFKLIIGQLKETPGLYLKKELAPNGCMVDIYKINFYYYVTKVMDSDFLILSAPLSNTTTEKIIEVRIYKSKARICEIFVRNADYIVKKYTFVYIENRNWIHVDTVIRSLNTMAQLATEHMLNALDSIPGMVESLQNPTEGSSTSDSMKSRMPWHRIYNSIKEFISTADSFGVPKQHTVPISNGVINTEDIESYETVVKIYNIQGEMDVVNIDIKNKKYSSLESLNKKVFVGQPSDALHSVLKYTWEDKSIIKYTFKNDSGIRKEYSRYNGAEWIPMEQDEFEYIFYNEMPRLDLDISAQHVNDGITVKTSVDRPTLYANFVVDDCLLIGKIMDGTESPMFDIERYLPNAQLIHFVVRVVPYMFKIKYSFMVKENEIISYYDLIDTDGKWLLKKGNPAFNYLTPS